MPRDSDTPPSLAERRPQDFVTRVADFVFARPWSSRRELELHVRREFGGRLHYVWNGELAAARRSLRR